MASGWSAGELHAISSSHELEIATIREDGTLRRWTPIWVVTAGSEVFVRTWYRRTTGWYGDAVTRRLAHIRVPGLEAEVHIEDIGLAEPGAHQRVNAAYAKKYGAGQMTDDRTASTTLRLSKRPAQSRQPDARSKTAERAEDWSGFGRVHPYRHVLVAGWLESYIEAPVGVGQPPCPDFVQVGETRGVHDMQDHAHRQLSSRHLYRLWYGGGKGERRARPAWAEPDDPSHDHLGPASQYRRALSLQLNAEIWL